MPPAMQTELFTSLAEVRSSITFHLKDLVKYKRLTQTRSDLALSASQTTWNSSVSTGMKELGINDLTCHDVHCSRDAL